MNYETLSLYSEVISSILFGVAIVVLFVKYLAPAVASVQAARNEEIAEAERRRDRASVELERIRAEHGADAASIAQLRERGRAEAARERDRLVGEARAEGERIVRNADGELNRARIAARSAFETRLIERALVQARDRARNEVSPGVDRDVTSLFLEGVQRGDHENRVAEVSNA